MFSCSVVVITSKVGVEGRPIGVADGDNLLYLLRREDVCVDVEVAGGEEWWG